MNSHPRTEHQSWLVFGWKSTWTRSGSSTMLIARKKISRNNSTTLPIQPAGIILSPIYCTPLISFLPVRGSQSEGEDDHSRSNTPPSTNTPERTPEPPVQRSVPPPVAPRPDTAPKPTPAPRPPKRSDVQDQSSGPPQPPAPYRPPQPPAPYSPPQPPAPYNPYPAPDQPAPPPRYVASAWGVRTRASVCVQ